MKLQATNNKYTNDTIILTNRQSPKLSDVETKVYTRDIFGND